MDAQVKKAVDELKVEPCRAYKERLIAAVNAADDSSRRMAITDLESYVASATHPSTAVLETIVALRRVNA